MPGRKIRNSLAVRLIPLLAVASALWAQTESQAVGEVIQIQGEWRIAGKSEPLLAGEGVPAGALIQPVSPVESDFIVVVLINRQRLSATCAAPRCDVSLQVPKTYIDEDVSFKSILDAVKFVLLDRRPEVMKAYVSTSSRSPGFKRYELVVPFANGGEIPIKSIVPALPKGAYQLEIRRIANEESVVSRTITLDGSNNESISLPSAFYLVTLDDDNGVPAAEIFVAAASAGSYPSIKDKFEQAKLKCAEWRGADAEDTAHLFLRSYLLSIAERQ